LPEETIYFDGEVHKSKQEVRGLISQGQKVEWSYLSSQGGSGRKINQFLEAEREGWAA